MQTTEEYIAKDMPDFFNRLASAMIGTKKGILRSESDPKSFIGYIVIESEDSFLYIGFRISSYKAYYGLYYGCPKKIETLALKNYLEDLYTAMKGQIHINRNANVIGYRWDTTKQQELGENVIVTRRVPIRSTDN